MNQKTRVQFEFLDLFVGVQGVRQDGCKSISSSIRSQIMVWIKKTRVKFEFLDLFVGVQGVRQDGCKCISSSTGSQIMAWIKK